MRCNRGRGGGLLRILFIVLPGNKALEVHVNVSSVRAAEASMVVRVTIERPRTPSDTNHFRCSIGRTRFVAELTGIARASREARARRRCRRKYILVAWDSQGCVGYGTVRVGLQVATEIGTEESQFI
jgi:hypothetical protein